jgi:hypothetical protein
MSRFLMFPSQFRAGILLLATLIVTTCGCNSGQKPTYPTKGKFVWEDGSNVKELSGGMVVFQCDSEEIVARAPIDQDGAFTIGTYTMDDGAVAGKHKVSVVQPADETAGDARALQVVDPKYESTATTDLEVTIEPKSNEIVLKVSPGAWMKKQKR